MYELRISKIKTEKIIKFLEKDSKDATKFVIWLLMQK
jgi:hypothetical protein